MENSERHEVSVTRQDPEKDRPAPKLGELLVREGVLTEEQKKRALAIQDADTVYKTLGEICLQEKFLTRSELNRVLSKYQKRIPLGRLLLNQGLITEKQLREALDAQASSKEKLGEIFVRKGIITEKILVDTLVTQMGVLKIVPDFNLVDKSLLEGLSEDFLRKNTILPAFKEKDVVTVIMADPFDPEMLQDVRRMFNCKIKPAIAPSVDIKRALQQHFQKVSFDLAPKMELKDAPSTPNKDLVVGDNGLSYGGGEGVVGILDFIISSAIIEGASDIHIEPRESSMQVRYRIDGILHHKTDLPVSIAMALTSRIKILCKMDISEKRHHQDGRIRAQIMDREVDLRVSSYAAAFGENVVIRILSRQSGLLDLDQLGIAPANRKQFEELMGLPSGIILVTGPTGSGKTTTLYSAINIINDGAKSIITVEDPVESVIEGVVQGQLNPKLGHTYVDFIKAMMRQDPDVIMVGEIRDSVAAEAVVQCSLTGHKVLTTLHTEDATGGLLRLLDMKIDPFLIASTVTAVMAQRLVRVLCPRCRKPYTPDRMQLEMLGMDARDAEDFKFFKAVGCSFCDHLGYRGRTGIHELLRMNDKMRDAIMARSAASELRRMARAEAGLMTMREDGFYKLLKGITSFEEISRVLPWQSTDDELVRTPAEVVAMAEGAAVEATTVSAPSMPLLGHAGASVSHGLEDEELTRVDISIAQLDKHRDEILGFFRAYRLEQARHGQMSGDPENEDDRFVAFALKTLRQLKPAPVTPTVTLVLRRRKGELEMVVEMLAAAGRGAGALRQARSGGPRLIHFIHETEKGDTEDLQNFHDGAGRKGQYRKITRPLAWQSGGSGVLPA